MPFVLRILASLLLIASAASAKEFKLYAVLLEDMPAELADGSKWQMDKGDVFPVLMYKEMQTKIVLQLAGTNFWTDTKRVRILKDSEVAAAIDRYRKNVEAYLKTDSEKQKKQLRAARPKSESDAR